MKLVIGVLLFVGTQVLASPVRDGGPNFEDFLNSVLGPHLQASDVGGEKNHGSTAAQPQFSDFASKLLGMLSNPELLSDPGSTAQEQTKAIAPYHPESAGKNPHPNNQDRAKSQADSVRGAPPTRDTKPTFQRGDFVRESSGHQKHEENPVEEIGDDASDEIEGNCNGEPQSVIVVLHTSTVSNDDDDEDRPPAEEQLRPRPRAPEHPQEPPKSKEPPKQRSQTQQNEKVDPEKASEMPEVLSMLLNTLAQQLPHRA